MTLRPMTSFVPGSIKVSKHTHPVFKLHQGRAIGP